MSRRATSARASHVDVYRQRLEIFLSSRDIARSGTREALGRAGLDNAVAAAADVSGYVDDALTIVRDEYRPKTDCREGCAFCCCKPGVLTTLPEFLRLLEYVRANFAPEDVEGLRERAKRYRAQLAGRSFDDPFDDVIPCPLLVADRCAAYEVRPLVCRGYNSTDVSACRAAVHDATAPVPIFAMLKDVTDGATIGVAHALDSAGLESALLDLGTALGLALGSDGPISLDAIRSPSFLSAAQNRSLVRDLWSAVLAAAADMGVPPPEPAR